MQMRNGLLVAAVSLLCATTSGAQTTDSALFAKAQQMVGTGEGAAGRALIDSVLGVVPAGSARYAEALYWRAALAGSPADAERSYRQIVVDYPMSPHVDDALLRMGQLELARGDREAALQHFQRLTAEHGDSPLRAKASYYAARAYLEKNDLKHACITNADALAHARPSDVELRNQIDFQNQRCTGVATTTPAPAQSASAAGETSVPESTAPAETVTETVVEPVEKPVEKPTVTKNTVTKETVKPVGKNVAKPVAKAAVKPSTGKFAVQIAAYYDRPQADALAEKMQKRGYVAHVDGTVAPFRVRIGHYASHAQAATALENMKAKKITGFVTQE
jgi:cell division septation protein DedD